MIQFTIKTLDSNNHQFSVDDETTVQQLKERIREQLGIEINLQRLIFCGRVLQDDKKLSEYKVDGKVVHLVQRAPPSPEFRNSGHSSTSSSHTATNTTNTTNTEPSPTMQQQIRRLMALSGPPDFVLDPQQSLSPSTGRMEFIRRMIGEIKASLACLRAHIAGEVRENSGVPASREAPEQMESETAPTTQDEPDPTIDDPGEEPADAATRAQYARRRSYRAIRALRARHSRPRDLGQLIEELEQLQEQFAPHRSHYVRLLRAANDPEPPNYDASERAVHQRTIDMVTDIIHSFAHAYHAISEISFPVGQRNPRLTSEANLMRQPIPMHAHINVIQSNRRPPSATATSGEGSGPNSTTNSTASNEGSTGTSAQAGRNTTQPTVNINIQPDLTYQVEIETRVPIAIPIENAMLTGLANASSPNQEQNQSQQNANSAQGQAQANRRQVLFDFENLFRGLGQGGTLGGVEVVMSMEELPQGGVLANLAGALSGAIAGTGTAGGNATNASGQHSDGAVFLAPMTWGGPPSADLLQNIVSSVIRQGLVPGMEVAVHAPIASQLAQAVQANQAQSPANQAQTQANQAQNQTQSQAQSQAQGQTTQIGQTQPQAHGLPTGQTQPQTQAQGQTQPQAQGQTSQPANQDGSSQQRQSNLHLRRATATSRAQAVALAGLSYDRYLHCESQHARRRMQRRRDQLQQQLVAHERIRNERLAAQNIETILDRNISNLTQDHMNVLLRVLNGRPTREGWLTALLFAIARPIFLSETSTPVPGEPPLAPTEFPPLRMMLRDYMQNLMARARPGDGDNSFEVLADYLTDEHADFLNNMHNITSLRPEVDPLRSVRALIRFRMPAAIASVMSESTSEIFTARFYSIFSRLFSDLGSMILYFCEDGVEGLRALFTAYVDHTMRPFEEPVRVALSTLAQANMTAIIDSIAANTDNIRLFIRRRGTAVPTPPPQRDEPSPMEVSPAAEEEESRPEQDFMPTRLEDIPLPSDPPPDNMPAFQEVAAPPSCQSETGQSETSQSETCQAESCQSEASASEASRSEPCQSQACHTNSCPLATCNLEACQSDSSQSTSDQECDLCEICHLPTESSPEVFETAIVPSARAMEAEAVDEARAVSVTEPAPMVVVAEARPMEDTPPLTEAPRPSSNPTNSSNPNNIRLVPPMVIVQHWGEEWVPVFARDQEAQSTAPPPEPYSDAYLSGMPSRKRRCVRQNRPATTLDGFMNESVREAASERATRVENQLLRLAFREHMRGLARQRADASEDYDPTRYSSAARFLNTRPDKKDSPETERKNKKK
ncbi:large proline-rich protein BAG6 isoform X2 [Amyelois transitella]|uniref:large proline-rich protein BAG6 isoform X2 n=1 Tax=Amyelois transitella TaxID=680683 RepID=UPI00298F8714|nr:large proline-rich protein BAG6 isoform X2 [Amyelois transitella]